MKICVLPGDGIGPEIIAEAVRVLKALDLKLEMEEALLGGCAVDATGSPYPDATQKLAQAADAVLLGAVGGPQWDNNPREQRPERGLLGIRKHLGLFANLRPAILYPELANASTLKAEVVAGLDILIVRELTGDIYFGQPRGIEVRTIDGKEQRFGFNTMHYTESEIRRILRVAFEAARKRSRKVCSVDKMNVLECTQLWRDVATETGKEYPDVELTHMLVDNAAPAGRKALPAQSARVEEGRPCQHRGGARPAARSAAGLAPAGKRRPARHGRDAAGAARGFRRRPGGRVHRRHGRHAECRIRGKDGIFHDRRT
jgi:3-isopropylmalate dehydrogenase